MSDHVQKEDATGNVQLENGSGSLLLEQQPFDATTVVAAIAAMTVAAYLSASPLHPRSEKTFIVQTAPEPAWITKPVNDDIAKRWGGISASLPRYYVQPVRTKPSVYVLLTEPRYPTPVGLVNPVIVVPSSQQQAMASYSLLEPRVWLLRVASDKTYLQQTYPSDGWRFANLSFGPSTAQTLPAFQQGGASYRMPQRSQDRTFIEQQPHYLTAWETFNEVAWPAINTVHASYWLPDAKRDRLFLQQEPRYPTAWPSFDFTLYPGIVEPSYLAPSRNDSPIQTAPIWPIAAPSAATVAQTLPPTVQEASSFRAPSRYGPDDAFVLITEPRYPVQWPTLDVAAAFPAINQATFRMAEREKKPLLSAPTWPVVAPAPFDAALFPAIDQSSHYLTPTRKQDQTYVRQTTHFLTPVAEFNFAGYVPSASQQRCSVVTPQRSLAPLVTAPTWPIAAPTTPFDAAVWPAIPQGVSYRMPEGWSAKFLTGSLQLHFPTPFKTFNEVLWPALETKASYFVPARTNAPIPTTPRHPTPFPIYSLWPALENKASYLPPSRSDASIQSAPTWPIPTPSGFDAAQFAPVDAQQRGSFRSADRNLRPIDTQPQPNFKGAVTLFEAYLSPPMADEQRSGTRTPARSVDVRPTVPNDGWISKPVSDDLAKRWPAIAEQPSYRMPDRASDRTYLQQTAPELAFIYNEVALAASATWPAVESSIPKSYRTADRNQTPIPTTPNAGWVEQEEEAQEALYVPVWAQQASSFVAATRRQDRTFILQGEPEPVYAATGNFFETPYYVAVADAQRSGGRTADRQSDRTFLQQTTPEDGWRYPVVAAALAAPWPGIEQELRGYRMPDSAADRFHVRNDVPQTAWYRVNFFVFDPAPYVGIYDQQRNGGYVAPKRSTDVRPTTPNDGWQQRAADAAVAKYVPAWEEARDSYRSAKRLDAPIPTTPNSGWEFTAVDAVLAKQLPARTFGFRMADRAQDKTYILQGQPEISWLLYPVGLLDPGPLVPARDAQRNGSYVTKARSVDVRPTAPNDGWISRPVALDLGKFWPAQTLANFLTRSRSVDVRQTQPQPIYPATLYGTADFPAIGDAQRNGSYRAPDAAKDRTFLQQTFPLPAWMQDAVDDRLARYYPAIEQELRGFRMPDSSADRYFIQQTTPEFGWIAFANIPPLVAQIDAQRNASYLTEEGWPDRLWFQTTPEFGWVTPVATENLGAYWPAIEQQLHAFRMEDRLFDTLRLATAPGWRPQPVDLNIYPVPLPEPDGRWTQQRRFLQWIQLDRPLLIVVSRILRTFIVEK